MDLIRERPGMYLGERSLTALRHFTDGYLYAAHLHRLAGRNRQELFPADFHDWVAYRLHFFESTSGWRNMILERTRSEAEALEKFYSLLDEHRARREHVVAKVTLKRRFYTQRCDDVTEELPYPHSLSLVTYTDDPGFFVTPDGKAEFPGIRFFPKYDVFDTFHSQVISRITIVDPKWNYGRRPKKRRSRQAVRANS